GFSGSGKSVTATYSVPASGGSWDAGDNGFYTVNIQANQIFDLDSPTPNVVQAGPVGGVGVGILNVTVVADQDNGDFSPNDLSLREAIEFANKLPGADLITFDKSVFGTPQVISLTLGTELAVTDSLTIQGPGAGLLTVSGANACRVFN